MLSGLAALLWIAVLVLPWRPWRGAERLEADAAAGAPVNAPRPGDECCVLIPARDEAERLPGTLAALAAQGGGLRVVVVDDCSRDATARVARDAPGLAVEVVDGQALPAGWSGKVWAQHQGEARLDRPLTLLLDADIELAPGMLAALCRRLRSSGAALVSVLAAPSLEGAWERLLMPAFVFFFRLLYPFALANDPRHRVAAGAGGCMLVRTAVLRQIGGFAAIRGELIDDCALAARVKRAGYPIWIGLSGSARSRRRYRGPGPLWRMVARTAFTQLRYSPAWLALCTLLMALAFVVPLAALAAGGAASGLGALALGAALAAYLPTVRYYRLAPSWALGLPLAGVLFLAMTWDSALGYWRGRRSAWRGRVYRRDGAAGVI